MTLSLIQGKSLRTLALHLDVPEKKFLGIFPESDNSLRHRCLRKINYLCFENQMNKVLHEY